MKRMFLLFSHTLTEAQEEDARAHLGVEEFCYLPSNLQGIWSAVDPWGELPEESLQEIVDFLREESQPGDVVLVQGDFGAVVWMVDACQHLDLVAVYATTYRQCVETRHPDGSVSMTHTFSHVQFRRYQRFAS